MKKLARRSFAVLLSLVCCTAHAQFKGGPDDGHTMALSLNQPLGRNIYVGGIDDGHTLALAASQPLGRNIYIGGIDDGHTVSLASSQPLGRNIYIGGVDDGHTLALSPNQPLGRNIYIGGIDDGHTLAAAPSQPLGRNIFTGGIDDGWAMALGTQAVIVPLPVTLLSFTGQWDGNNALLEWKTASETHTDRFELERSYDATTFRAIGSVAAAGQSTTARNYRYADSAIRLSLPRNIVYYRLRNVDVDGSFTYSGIVILNTSRDRTIQYTLFPNPARDRITVSASELTERTVLQLRDVTGRIVMQESMTNRQQSLSVSSLAAGTYFLQLSAGDQILYTQKLIISK